MASCWLTSGTALLMLIFSLSGWSPVQSQSSCHRPGTHGVPGTHGPYGRDGPKGDKGEPGESFSSSKGDPGTRGPAGRPGPKGNAGLIGPPGYRGQQGEKGRPFNPYTRRVLFSLKRELSASPENDKPMAFNMPILSNPAPQDVSFTNNSFICEIPGVYFFSFHISVKGRVCLKLLKGSDIHMTMCDYWDGYLVTSGSAMLTLQAGDSVSLQTTRFNQIVTVPGSSHTFNGFLIYSI